MWDNSQITLVKYLRQSESSLGLPASEDRRGEASAPKRATELLKCVQGASQGPCTVCADGALKADAKAFLHWVGPTQAMMMWCIAATTHLQSFSISEYSILWNWMIFVGKKIFCAIPIKPFVFVVLPTTHWLFRNSIIWHHSLPWIQNGQMFEGPHQI